MSRSRPNKPRRITQRPTLRSLIAAHAAAEAAFSQAIDAEEDCTQRARKPVLVPIALQLDGQSEAWCDLRYIDAEDVKRRILERAKQAKTSYEAQLIAEVRPEAHKELLNSIDRVRRRSLRALDEALAGFDEHGDRTASKEAEARREAASNASLAAVLAVVLYRPKDRAEARAKARFLEENRVRDNDGVYRSLLDELCAIAAPRRRRKAEARS